jgi:hypothetical protein
MKYSGLQISKLKKVMLNHDSNTHIATTSLEFKGFTYSHEFLDAGKVSSYI